MAIEQGIVTRMGDESSTPTAWVKIVRTGACESCSSRHHCNLGKSDTNQEVETVNPVQARIGDHIQVVMNTGSFLKATFLLYVFPILCMLGGGLLGQGLSSCLNVQGSILSVAFSIIFLAVAMILVRIKGRRMGSDSEYRPRILRIIGRKPAEDAAET